MLAVLAYDIASPKRLQAIAKTCKDFGVRIQKSIFECHLDPPRFDSLWEKLSAIVVPEEDSLVAYQINAADAQRTRTLGRMERSEQAVSYVY
ncbi:MAG: CRISPR-associated endonuclease Cas2 [Puniceicoccales bacterium]|jgi:CRISPR-associated protein Cas2|nr:CRISPR-associated endonuclease Cas2 [Puniceicoccales bacterium]